MKTPARRHLYVALFGLICVLSLVVLDASGFFTTTDNRLTDRLIIPRAASSDIVIVAIDDKSIQEFGVWPWPRSLHAQMIDALTAADPKVIGYDVTFSEASAPTQDERLRQALIATKRIVIAKETTNVPLTMFYQNPESLAEIIPANTAVITDADGIVRSIPSFVSAPQDYVFSKKVVAEVTRSFPVTEPIIRIPFIGGPRTFTTYSFSDVLNETVPPESLKNKIVLVGATAPDLHDAYLVPTSHGDPMSGIEIHANAIQAFMEGRELKTLPFSLQTLLMAVLGCLLVLLSLFLRLRYLVFSLFGMLACYLLLAVGLSLTDLLLPITAPLLLIILISGVDIASRYLAEKSQRRFIHTAFAHYLAPAVIEKLVKGETKLELGGIKRELTILFSDIRGFTSLSEKLKPEELVPFLNEYLTAMTDVVLDSEGVVDKYIGDAIMAFWGAPIPQNDHAIRSAMTAIKMKRKLSELQAAWSKSGKPRIDIGIGVNTGEVLVGNMGSKQRFDYTVIGDDVNLASRLEGLTKQYGVTALISEATRNKLGDSFMVRELDLVAVKGRTQPVRIFELVEERGSTDGLTLGAIEKFEQALARYRKQDWDGAAQIFDTLSATDKPSAVFLDRIKYLKEHPPETSWDGSFTAKEK